MFRNKKTIWKTSYAYEFDGFDPEDPPEEVVLRTFENNNKNERRIKSESLYRLVETEYKSYAEEDS